MPEEKNLFFFALGFVMENIGESYLAILVNLVFIPKHRIVVLTPLFYTIDHSVYISALSTHSYSYS